MRTIIAGSRHFTDYELMCKVMANLRWTVTEVVSGKAPGADTLGERWASENNIPVKEFPADWSKFHRAAGPIRNKQMADYAEACVVFLYPNSRGSINMYEQARKKEMPLVVVQCETGLWIESNVQSQKATDLYGGAPSFIA